MEEKMLADVMKKEEKRMEEANGMLPLGCVPTSDIAQKPLFDRKPKTEEGSEPLKKAKHEKIAQLVAYEGKTFAEAYMETYGCGWNEARASASRLKGRHPELEKRVAFMNRELITEMKMHKGITLANMLNKSNSIIESMMPRKSDPKYANAILGHMRFVLDATALSQDGTTTTVEERREVSGESNVLAGLDEKIARARAIITTTTTTKE